jgi:hypothetical protein
MGQPPMPLSATVTRSGVSGTARPPAVSAASAQIRRLARHLALTALATVSRLVGWREPLCAARSIRARPGAALRASLRGPHLGLSLAGPPSPGETFTDTLNQVPKLRLREGAPSRASRRRPKLTAHQKREALARHEAGEPLTENARSYNVTTPPSHGCKALGGPEQVRLARPRSLPWERPDGGSRWPKPHSATRFQGH